MLSAIERIKERLKLNGVVELGDAELELQIRKQKPWTRRGGVRCALINDRQQLAQFHIYYFTHLLCFS